MKLSDIVASNAIVPALRSPDRDGTIEELLDALVTAGAAEKRHRDQLLTLVLEREKRSSTGFGKGVAVPHVKHKSVTKVMAAIGLSQRGTEFSALDRQPVYSVFLLLSPEDFPEEHLQAMEVIFGSLSRDEFRRALRQCQTTEDVQALIRESDQKHLGG